MCKVWNITVRGCADAFKRTSGVRSVSLVGGNGEVALLERRKAEKEFQCGPKAALRLGVPVVVVDGYDDSTARTVLSIGVPQKCAFAACSKYVCDLTGKGSALVAKKGAKLRTALAAVERDVSESLTSELLAWLPEEEQAGALLCVADAPPAPEAEFPAPHPSPIEAQMKAGEVRGADAADKVIVVFRNGQDAPAGDVAREVVAALGGVHVEVSEAPSSHSLYGATVEEAVKSGRYAYASPGSYSGPGWLTGGCVAVEVDVDIMAQLPDLVHDAYQKAEFVVHAAGAESADALRAWMGSGWRLDAIVATPEAYGLLKKEFGAVVYPDAYSFVSVCLVAGRGAS